jgi:hypothetical protein
MSVMPVFNKVGIFFASLYYNDGGFTFFFRGRELHDEKDIYVAVFQ